MRLRTKFCLSLLLSLAVSGCGTTASPRLVSPSATDITILQKEKPKYKPEYLKSTKLNDKYNADVESWGEQLSDAGRRLCIWYNERGSNFKCRKE